MRRNERTTFGALMAVGVALIVVIILLVVVWGQASDATSALKADVQNQVQNRTSNVATWCNAINTSRDYDRTFIRHVTRGHLVYTLGDLNCAVLEAKTLASTRSH